MLWFVIDYVGSFSKALRENLRSASIARLSYREGSDGREATDTLLGTETTVGHAVNSANVGCAVQFLQDS